MTKKKIGQVSNSKILQMPDASEGFLLYAESSTESGRSLRGSEGDADWLQGLMCMRILLGDGQPKVRFALRVLLEQQPGLEVAGEASDADDLLAQAAMVNPDLVLLGWELPGLVDVGSLTALRRICPDVSVIALSGRPEARQVALLAGADAFVSKFDPPEQLLAAIDAYRHVQRL
jgi:CheY-like chemotaxis protein